MIKRFFRSLSFIGLAATFTFPAQANIFKQVAFFVQYVAKETKRRNTLSYKQPGNLPAQELKDAALLAQELKAQHAHSPVPFLVGASTAEYQCSNKSTYENSSWFKFAQDFNLPLPTDPAYKLNQKNWWDHYTEFIDKAAEMGLNAIRFSVEWALIQPSKPAGISLNSSFEEIMAEKNFNLDALNHYADVACYMIKKGITPVFCMHHYNDPRWFLELNEIKTKHGLPLGGFESRRNSIYFEAFCTRVYTHIMDALCQDPQVCTALEKMHAPLWATFNSPTGYAFKNYRPVSKEIQIPGLYTQGPTNNPQKATLQWTMQVLAHMMDAHVKVYQSLHATYKKHAHRWAPLSAPAVGLLHNIHQLHPQNFYSAMSCVMGEMLQHEAFYNFFEKGTFRAYIPFAVNVEIKNSAALTSLDWIGLNHYSDGFMKGSTKLPCSTIACEEYRRTASENYYLNGKTLYRALLEIAHRLALPVGKNKGLTSIPIYVTENGIAARGATQEEQGVQRTLFYKEYLNALVQAQKELAPRGVMVNGYLTWALFDNYEWPHIKPTPSSAPTIERRQYGLLRIEEEGRLVQKEGLSFFTSFAHALSHQGQQLASLCSQPDSPTSLVLAPPALS